MVLPNKILTPLQEAVLHALFSLTDAFYLTGGTALSAYYLEHRLSIDLDFSEKMTIKPCSENDLVSFREDLIQQCLTMQG
jgi:predicted nucleotidyltransferase component of viral defense system